MYDLPFAKKSHLMASLRDIFFQQAAVSPDATAVTVCNCTGGNPSSSSCARVSYRELSRTVADVVTAVSSTLSTQRTVAAIAVGVCCPPASVAAPAAILAVLSTGAGYVPLPTTAIETYLGLLRRLGLSAILAHGTVVELWLLVLPG